MLSNETIEKRCRRTIAKYVGRLHKEGKFYWVELDISRCTGHPELTERPDSEDSPRWMDLDRLIDYCEGLEAKHA